MCAGYWALLRVFHSHSSDDSGSDRNQYTFPLHTWRACFYLAQQPPLIRLRSGLQLVFEKSDLVRRAS